MVLPPCICFQLWSENDRTNQLPLRKIKERRELLVEVKPQQKQGSCRKFVNDGRRFSEFRQHFLFKEEQRTALKANLGGKDIFDVCFTSTFKSLILVHSFLPMSAICIT